MKIDSKTEIAGYPALEMRKFLRSVQVGLFHNDGVRKHFKTSRKEAERIIQALIADGYVEVFHAPDPRVKDYWRLTMKGNGLAEAAQQNP